MSTRAATALAWTVTATDRTSTPTVPDGNPAAVEFLGNGCPYPGQCYSRAAILFWPTKDRAAIIGQSEAGAASQAAAAAE